MKGFFCCLIALFFLFVFGNVFGLKYQVLWDKITKDDDISNQKMETEEVFNFDHNKHYLVLASWYGKKFHGRKTANGEVYNMYGISAAHKTLPFGTIVQVINPENGRQLEVKINDRGPYIEGRSLDLSFGAAKKLDIVEKGIANLIVKVIE